MQRRRKRNCSQNGEAPAAGIRLRCHEEGDYYYDYY
jgi:hypothetical protein